MAIEDVAVGADEMVVRKKVMPKPSPRNHRPRRRFPQAPKEAAIFVYSVCQEDSADLIGLESYSWHRVSLMVI